MDLTAERLDREIAKVQAAVGGKKSPSIRELLEKTQDSEFREKLTGLVAPIKASNASGRYPTVAQVRKMLAANDNVSKDFVDYSEVASEYKALFEQCLAESGDVNSLLKKLSKELRVNPAALAAVVNALTGRDFSKVTFADAKAAIFDEFAHRGVSIIAKRAAGDSKPF